jgi:spermidine synthase
VRVHSAILPVALLFVSGTAALVYQLLWIKQLALVVGVEVYAVTTSVSAFFAGLAIGGLYFGRRADRSLRPLRLYAQLECGVALLGVAATFALGAAAGPFARLEALFLPLAWLLPFALVGIPALLMGGTLPVLLRALQPDGASIGASGGRLYAANTAGAIVGALLAPFVLIPLLGVRGAALTAAALNLVAAIVAFAIDRAAPARSMAAATPDLDQAAAPAGARVAVIVYAIAGGIALGYEVVWSQAIAQFMSTRAFAFAIVLATYLAGLVFGSAIAARHADRTRDPWAVFGLLIAVAGLVALLEIALLGGWLLQLQSQVAAAIREVTDSGLASMSGRFIVAALSIVFVPTLLLGAAFPFVLRMAVGAGAVGRGVGSVVALNTLGGIAGSLLVGFVLVPWLGLVHTLEVLAVCAALLGAYATLRTVGSSPWRFATFGVGIAALIVAALTPADRLATLLVSARGGTLTAYEESHGGTVAVIEQQSGQNRFNRLYIQGVSNSGDSMTSLRYMRLQALLPLIIHRGEPASALVIGLGTGITGGALLAYPTLQQRVVAELLPAVVRAVPKFRGNYHVASDVRMQIRVRDGRRELLRNEQRYDLITLEPPPPSAAGVAALYSSDFYQLAESRLQADGLVAQWLPLPTQNEDDTRSLVRSFLDVFPYATLWTTELHEMMLVGSMSPIELDLPHIAARFDQPEVSKALGEVGIDSPAALMATWVTDRAGLERFVADAPPVTDDRPRIEYAGWVRREDFSSVLSHLLGLYSVAPLTGADSAFLADLATRHQQLMRFYSAGLYAYEGDREGWARDIDQVLKADPDNPYYRWFFGPDHAGSTDTNDTGRTKP